MKNSNKAELALFHSIIPPTSQSPQATQGFAGSDAIAPCPECGHTGLNLVRMPDYSLHYAARRCGQCDIFRGWEPKPENQNKQQLWQTTIAALLKSPQLTDWERTFLEKLKGKKISPKQQEVLARIEAKVGGQR